MKQELEERVRQWIQQEQLLRLEGRYLVAVSGGADSVALLLILQRLGYQLEAVHCNFHLRREESDRDEAFVVSLCEQRNIPLHRIHFDTQAYASLHRVSIEMAARELRYCYFEQLRQDVDADGVCVAHHRDDAVETLLMNLLRGSGVHGLTGIRTCNGYIIRPLLNISREEIEAYLKNAGQSFVTDSTNLEDDALRNKIRHHLVPILQQINPAASTNIWRSARYLAEAERLLDASVSESLSRLVNNASVDIDALKKEPSPSLLLHEWLQPYGFSSAMIPQVMESLEGPSGKVFSSATHDLLIDRGRLLLEPHQEPFPDMLIPEPGTYRCADGRKLRVRLEEGCQLSRDAHCCTLDAHTVCFPLTLRTAHSGDRFVPLGMNGQKLVSDFLTDCKQNLLEKRRQLVLEDASHQIVWLVNRRPANPFRIQPSTQQTLVITLEASSEPSLA